MSGIDILFADSCENSKYTSASLDRIDSSKGYIEGNVQWVHKDINKIKTDMSDNKFIEWCKLIAEYNKVCYLEDIKGVILS